MTADTSDLTHQTGSDVVVRGQFVSTGNLTNTDDTNFRAINDAFPVFGFAIDLGSVGSMSTSSLFTINLNQDDVIVFEGAEGNQTLPSLALSYFASDLDADTFFYNDYETARGTADEFDNKVASASAAAAGDNYTTITSLSARQAFASLQLAGTINETLLFMKEISSDGNTNTADSTLR